MITQEELKQYLTYDPETGRFTWIKSPANRALVGASAGSMRLNLYINITLHYKKYLAHRLAFLYMTGEIPKLVDHINRKPFDNRWANLRASNRRENALNVGAWSE